jgi:hypothetical protein
VEPD